MAKAKDEEKAETPSGVRFRIEGDDSVYAIDPYKLTFGEMSRAEQVYGCSYAEIISLHSVDQRFTLLLLGFALERAREAGQTGPATKLTAEELADLHADDVELIEEEEDPPTQPSPSPSGEQT